MTLGLPPGVRPGQQEVDGERRVIEGIGRPTTGDRLHLGEHGEERCSEVAEAGPFLPFTLPQVSGGDAHAVTAAKRSTKPSAGTTTDTGPDAGRWE